MCILNPSGVVFQPHSQPLWTLSPSVCGGPRHGISKTFPTFEARCPNDKRHWDFEKTHYGLIMLVSKQTGVVEVNWLCVSSLQSICWVTLDNLLNLSELQFSFSKELMIIVSISEDCYADEMSVCV